ncbi:MAG: GtrA family protein [Pedobacter sp.]|nr:MAG: GtrA family protein [Pedobacter sp.]
MRKAILAFIDFFHPPFKKYISLHNFRYLTTGGTTFVLGLVVYYLSFNYLFKNEEVDVLFFTVKKGIAAYAVDFAIVIPFSFLVNRYIVFTHSENRGRVQLFRFMNLQFINILLNVFLYKFFADVLFVYPTIARLVVGVLVAGFSYLYQHYFTFSVKKLGKKG